MNGQERSDRADAISADDAERLLAGGEVGLGDPPVLLALHQLFETARRPGEDAELAQLHSVVAAFRAARTTSRPPATRPEARLKGMTRRTIAIIGIAASGSMGAAFATGAVGRPFTAPPQIDHGPDTTQPPLEPTVPSVATSAAPATTQTTSSAPPVVATVAEPHLTPSEPAATPPMATEPVGDEASQSASVNAPGQTSESFSVNAPGQTSESSQATAPGQTAERKQT
jgi:hypothetical protein